MVEVVEPGGNRASVRREAIAMAERRRIWTAGHSDRSAERFVSLLAEHGIRRVADVRSHPWSRRHPWHGRAEMEGALAAASIGYSWLGARLGGMRAGGYAAHRQTAEYREGLDELARLASLEAVAVVCAERDPWHCHRRFIADDLARAGFDVRHVIDEGHAAPHQPSLI